MAHTTYTKRGTIALACACSILLSGYASPTTSQPTSNPMVQEVVASAAATALNPSIEQGYLQWFAAHARARVIEVYVEPRDPVSFGPWFAEKDYGAADAREDGSLTEWGDLYYITHSWSDYGQQILCMSPGDTVQINNRTIMLTGVFNYPKDSYLEEIREVCGDDVVIIQTCYPDSDENRIVYGS